MAYVTVPKDLTKIKMLPLYGHMSGRISLTGYDPRPLTSEELDRLDGLMASALEAVSYTHLDDGESRVSCALRALATLAKNASA